MRNTISSLLHQLDNIMKNKINITGKTLIDLGFRSGKWFPKAIEHINTHQLADEAMHAYLEQYKMPPIQELHKTAIDFKINIKAANELEKDNPKVCCKGEEFTAFTIPQWADSIKNQNKDG